MQTISTNTNAWGLALSYFAHAMHPGSTAPRSYNGRVMMIAVALDWMDIYFAGP